MSSYESQVQAYIKSDLIKMGYEVIKNGTVSQNGWPDLTSHRNEKTFFIEVKRLGLEPSPLQSHIHDRLRAQGFVVVVLDSIQAYKLFKTNNLRNGQEDVPVL